MRHIRLNYKILCNEIDPNLMLNTKWYKRRCDICRSFEATSGGDVHEFSFYCQSCCDAISMGPCAKCRHKNIRKNKLCIVCFNSKKRKSVGKKQYSKHIGQCDICNTKNKHLVDVYRTRLCIQCCNRVGPCKLCGRTTLSIKGVCIGCNNSTASRMKSNYYFPLMWHTV